MAVCRRCDTPLPGRRQLCDTCKAARPGTVDQAATDSAPATKPTTKTAKSSPRKSSTMPAGLHVRGRALWKDLDAEAGTMLGELALEACRMADRLDELDRIVAGKGVLQLMTFRLSPDWWDSDGEQHVHVTVGFQSVLAESRMQASTFKDLLKELRQLKTAPARPGMNPGAAGPAPAPPPATGLDQLAARRAGRVPQTS